MRIFFCHVVLAPVLVLILSLGPFVQPSSAASVETGDVLVADPESGTIRQYSAAGVDRGAFASGLSSPSWITVDRFGNVYVSEHDGPRITKFSPSGTNLMTIMTPYKPGGISVSAADGTIYVTDYVGGGVYRYSASGTDLGLFVSTSLSPADFIALDAFGNLYVTGTDKDLAIEVVRRFPPTSAADFVPDFTAAAGMAFGADGNLYVSSFVNDIVEKFSPSGEDLGAFALTGLSASLMGIAFDASGNLYVANFAERNVLRSSPTGGGDLAVFVSTDPGRPRDLVIIPALATPPLVVPTIKEECKTDGWQSFDVFTNQGDCIQYINTGK